ncbi:MAG: hypothetical protein IID54_03255 [Proteobacteria bacterium]|nr:hypothetical protein [Pseudomonadota bacterium]
MMRVLFLAVLLLLSACGESTEDAYERGYEEGVDEICFAVSRLNDSVYDSLREKRIC